MHGYPFFTIFFFLLFLVPQWVCGAFLFDKDKLKLLKDTEKHTSTYLKPTLDYFFLLAEQGLQTPCYSVMDKTMIPPSGDKHDYMSLRRYFWPNTTPNKFPYIRRDGFVNPDIWTDSYDYKNKIAMTAECKALSLAYFFTQDEKYAEQAVKKLTTWFINSETRMNPHLSFSQMIPGEKFTGNPYGIIETYSFPLLLDIVSLLEEAPSWTTQHQEALKLWFRDYLKWLLSSPNGIKEGKTKNNHGSWYDLQVIYFALYTDQANFAKKYIQDRSYMRLNTQFKDGQQPHELIRTKSFYYCCYNLQALFLCAQLGEEVNENLWEYPTKEKAILRTGLDWLLQFCITDTPWIRKDIEPIEPKLLAPLLLMAADKYQDPKYLTIYHELIGDFICDEPWQLIYMMSDLLTDRIN